MSSGTAYLLAGTKTEQKFVFEKSTVDGGKMIARLIYPIDPVDK